MKQWEKEKAWSDKFMPEIKGILGQCFIGIAEQDEDCERNTDLMVFKMDATRIACRVRRNDYLAKYSDEFTIRSATISGHKTEIHKLMAGWGDYMFYGFADSDGKGLALWRIIDLKVFRYYIVSHMARNRGKMPGKCNSNLGGNSFMAFSVKDMPKDAVFAESEVAYA